MNDALIFCYFEKNIQNKNRANEREKERRCIAANNHDNNNDGIVYILDVGFPCVCMCVTLDKHNLNCFTFKNHNKYILTIKIQE